MKRIAVSLLAVLAAALLAAGCGQAAAPAPAATSAPAQAAPTTAAAAPAAQSPAPAAQPAAPAAAYPQKGKAIEQIVPFGSGGGADITARAMQPQLEKELGVPMPVINKAGGSGQVGMTDYLKGYKTDGYGLVWMILPAVPASYLDPERKATYSGKDIQPVANIAHDPLAIAVKKGSKFKTLKDVVDYAKANPGKLRLSSAGLMSPAHVGGVMLERAAGIKVAHMFFEQQGEQRAALLGEHLEVEMNPTSEIAPGLKGGDLDVLAVFDTETNPFLPGVQTAKSQGFDVVAASTRGIGVKAGTPKEVVSALDAAVAKVVKSPEAKAQFDKMNMGIRYLNPDEYAKYFGEVEQSVKVVLEATKK